ncbi:MAG TPA: hypothetical protein PKB05_07820 [Oligoflexia bacterium]|nr:hypothetical protein [Oligoflexia bacterium]
MRWDKKFIVVGCLIFCSGLKAQTVNHIWVHCTLLKVNSMLAQAEDIVFIGLLALGQNKFLQLNRTESIELNLQDDQIIWGVHLNSGSYEHVQVYEEYNIIDVLGDHHYQLNCTRLPGSKISIQFEEVDSIYKLENEANGKGTYWLNKPSTAPKKF